MYIYNVYDVYVREHYIRSICRQLLFCFSRAHQRSLVQMKILKDHSAQTTTRAAGKVYRLWPSLSINRVLNLTKLRRIISDPRALWCFMPTAQSQCHMVVGSDGGLSTLYHSVIVVGSLVSGGC